MSTKIILATGCDAVFYNFLQETLSSWIRLGLPARADIGIVDMGLSAEQIAALEAQGYAIVVPGWTINVPQELRDGFMIGNVAKTALRDYFPGYDVYLWFDADAWAQTGEFFDAFVAGALAEGAAVVREDGFGYKRNYLYNRWWYGHMMAGFGLRSGFRIAYKPAINSGIFGLSAGAPHWKLWAKTFARLIESRRRLNLDQHALNAAIDLFDLPEARLPARCNWIATLSHPVWDSQRRLFCTPGPDPSRSRSCIWRGRTSAGSINSPSLAAEPSPHPSPTKPTRRWRLIRQRQAKRGRSAHNGLASYPMSTTNGCTCHKRRETASSGSGPKAVQPQDPRRHAMTTLTLRRALLAAMLVATAAVGACNTAEGIGKDVESTGDAVKDTARDAKR